jgi:hypothetical protein
MPIPLNETIIKPAAILGGNPLRVTAAGTWVCRNYPITIDEIIWSGVTADDAVLVIAKGTAATDLNTLAEAQTDTGDDRVIFKNEKTFINMHVVTLSSGTLLIHLK